MRIKRIIILGSTFFAALCLVYGSGIFNAFINLDDPSFVINNPYLQASKELCFLLKNAYQGHYQPITWVSYFVLLKLGNLFPALSDAFTLHGFAFIVHWINAILVYYLLRLFGLKNDLKAVFLSSLFLLHPLIIEPLLWVSGLNTLLAGLFGLLAIVFCVKFFKGQKKWLYYALSIFFMVCSLLSKPILIAFPLIMGAYLLLTNKKALKFIVPYFLVSILVGLMALNAASGFGSLNMLEHQVYGWNQRVIIVLHSLSYYFCQFIYPKDLSPIHILPSPIELGQWGAIYGRIIVFVLFLAIVAATYWKTRSWVLFFGIAWYVCFLLPNLQVVLLGHNGIADRYGYFPMIGLFLVGSFFMDYFFNKLALATFWKYLIYGGVLTFFIYQGAIYKQHWKSSTNVYKKSQKMYPNSGYLEYALALSYKDNQQYDSAIFCLERAIEKHYLSADVLMQMGGANVALQHYYKARADFTRAIQLFPSNKHAYLNRANVSIILNEFDLAHQDLSKCIELDSHYWIAYQNRAWVSLNRGDCDGAFTDYNRAISGGLKDQNLLEKIKKCQQVHF